MTLTDQAAVLVGMLIRQFPMMVIAIIGLWFAFSRRDKLGQAATWALWGFSLLIAYAICGALLQVVLMTIRTNEFMQSGSTRTDAIITLNLWALAAYPLFIGGLAAIARAVFLGRSDRIGDSKQQAVAGAA